jgi:hypothetical protein
VAKKNEKPEPKGDAPEAGAQADDKPKDAPEAPSGADPRAGADPLVNWPDCRQAEGFLFLQGGFLLVASAPEGVDLKAELDKARESLKQGGSNLSHVFSPGVSLRVIPGAPRA